MDQLDEARDITLLRSAKYQQALRCTNLFRHKHKKELFITAKDMYMGQFIYCSHRIMLPISDTLPLCKTFKGATICNIEHHTSDYGAPPPGHLGTTPSSSTATPTTVPERKAPPTVGRSQRMTTRLMMLGTL
ncbi:uncharacterized protein [Miscanthus floridulus]|uniref:uncharacterized protein n=1 Tax=Miscanthus floridulus TaxID=154761 RepID=UPI00345A2E70